MSNFTQPLKIIFSKLSIQAKIMMWKIKYVSEDLIKN